MKRKGGRRIRMSAVFAWLGVLFACLSSFGSTSTGRAASETTGDRPICEPKAARSIASTSKVRVYSLPANADEKSPRLFGCLAGTLHSYRLNATPKHPIFGEGRSVSVSSEAISIAAPRVSYAETFYGVDTSVLAIAIKDLSKGTTAYCKVAFTEAPAPKPVVTKIAISATWSVGWIGRSRPVQQSGRSPLTPSVGACDSAGSRVIESGNGLDLQSLTLRGSRLTWLNGGKQHSAKLAPKESPK
jgi:hypothetical protein